MATATLPKGSANVGSNLWSDVYNNDNALATQVNGNLDATNLAANAVTTTKITDANVTDAKLASPNNSVYKTVASTPFFSIAGAIPASGTHYFTAGGVATAGGVTPSSGLAGTFDYVAADYSVGGGLAAYFRVRAQVAVGSTSPSTVTLAPKLLLVSMSAGAFSMGSVVATATGPTPALATNTISRYASSDVLASSLTDGTTYVFGVVPGSITVPANIAIAFELQTRNA